MTLYRVYANFCVNLLRIKFAHSMTTIYFFSKYIRSVILIVVACIAQMWSPLFAQHPNHTRISVILPFKANLSEGQKSLEFYRGFLLAIEEYKAANYNISISAFDEGTPDSDISDILTKATDKSDIIIGPFYRNHMLKAGHALSNSEKCVVFPWVTFLPNDLRNATSCYINTITASQKANEIQRIITASYNKPNIIYIKSSHSNANETNILLADALKKHGAKVSVLNDAFGISQFNDKLNKRRKNFIITDIVDIDTLKILFSKIINYQSLLDKQDLCVIANTEWTDHWASIHESIKNLEVFLPILDYNNPELPAYVDLKEKYQNWFNCPTSNISPSPMITGYQIARYFINRLQSENSITTTNNRFSLPCDMAFFTEKGNTCWTRKGIKLIHYSTNGSCEILELLDSQK